MNFYYFPIITVSAYIMYHFGKEYLSNYVLAKVNEELAKKQNDEGITFKTLEKSKSAVVLYKYGGKEHKVCIPYDRSKSTNMLRKEVRLVIDQEGIEEKIDITHKPGVPYLLSANDMGGSKIIILKDNKIIKEYIGNEIPNYLE